MKKYLKPSAEITKFEVEDSVMAIGTSNINTDPGWGDLKDDQFDEVFPE